MRGAPKRGFGCGYAAPGYSLSPGLGTSRDGGILTRCVMASKSVHRESRVHFGSRESRKGRQKIAPGFSPGMR